LFLLFFIQDPDSIIYNLFVVVTMNIGFWMFVTRYKIIMKENEVEKYE